jgi:nucleotide-binding universal stress UspA family protein
MRVMLATDGSDHAMVATEWVKSSLLPASAEVMVVAAAGLPLLLPEMHEAECPVLIVKPGA